MSPNCDKKTLLFFIPLYMCDYAISYLYDVYDMIYIIYIYTYICIYIYANIYVYLYIYIYI